MKLTKQTVYLHTNGYYDYLVRDHNDNLIDHVEQKEGYFFTQEQLNQFLSDVIKDTLNTAADKAEDWDSFNSTINKESITNTFEETFKKFEV